MAGCSICEVAPPLSSATPTSMSVNCGTVTLERAEVRIAELNVFVACQYGLDERQIHALCATFHLGP